MQIPYLRSEEENNFWFSFDEENLVFVGTPTYQDIT